MTDRFRGAGRRLAAAWSRAAGPGEARRFLLAGAANTVATYFLYLALVRLAPYAVAYSISYVAGIVLSYFANVMFVFRVAFSWKGVFRYPAVYAVQYLCGLGALAFAVSVLRLPQWLAAGLAVAVSVPVTFLLCRWALGASRPPAEGGHG